MAHVNAGKTTTSERMLYYAGVTSRMGEVDHGSATMDWMEQEQERGITITAASTSFAWRAHHCNLIDMPGHVDFTVEVERSLRVLDGAIAIFCARQGVESQSEAVWRQADRYSIPRIAFVNKCDRPGADPERVTNDIRTRLSANPIVLQIPHGLEEDFDGIVDLVAFRSLYWDDASLGLNFEDTAVPDSLLEEALFARNLLIEELAEVDDLLMEKYLSASDITSVDIKQGLRRATLALRAVPVVVGSAKKNKGVQPLLDAVVDYLPSPADVPPTRGRDPSSGLEMERFASDEEPSAALAFKIMNDPASGRLTYLRVYSGVLREGVPLLNSTRNQQERPLRLVKMHANHRENVGQLHAGDIGAATGLQFTSTGDTLCELGAPVRLEQMRFPEPMAEIMLIAETDDDDERLAAALAALLTEDPTFRLRPISESGATCIAGMGELHLEILLDRLRREFDISLRAGKPTVAYRETPTIFAASSVTYDHRVGGRGHFAGLEIEVAPLGRGTGRKILAEGILELPRAMLEAATRGIEEALERGLLSGYPMVDLEIRILAASYHPVDSSEMSFKVAGLRAIRDALERSEPALLEPLVDVEVITPGDHVGDIVGDLSARRGKIAGIEARHGVQVIACVVPLAEMFGYATDLRSKTQGRAAYSMQFKQYSEVPTGLVGTIVAKTAGA